MKTSYSIIGSGSWATALTKILTENGHAVCWYVRKEDTAEYIRKHKHNPNYLTDVTFNTDRLVLTTDLNEAVAHSDYLVLVIPSAFLAGELQSLNLPLSGKIIFSAVKGIVPESGLIVGEHLNQKHQVPLHHIGVIAGPCHAEEVALERLSYLTIACTDTFQAKIFANSLSNNYIKTKISDDIIGTEYAAMLKNIYAIAAGMAHGLGYGDNFQSVLMSNAIREMQRYIERENHMKRNITDSAYLGDLLVTGYSVFSRNRMLGNMIGKGYTLKSAFMEMNMVAEGYYAVKSAYQRNRSRQIKTKTHILNTVYDVLYEKKNVRKAFDRLADNLD
ncbi:MAG: NAD(P)-binding domain-containing protein [Capnocytophaga sp.]|nr:NAD(P)-binding domain-containing protein [Capnocytophaga sp.]